MKHLLPTLFITLLILGCGTENEPTFELTVSVVGEGTVTPSTGVFSKGEEVTITTNPSNGWKFSRWEGNWSGTMEQITLKMDRDYTIIGVFEKRDYPLTITIEGEGTVTERVVTAKTTEYPFQTVVELTPTPSEGWRFKEWGGDLTGSDVPKRITVDGNKTVTVKFENLYSLHPNGETILCPNTMVGDKWVLKGISYETVDRGLLIRRRDEGADLTKVCTSLVTRMDSLFIGTQFNQPIGNWDVSSVTSMYGMFYNSNFNQPIGNWNVSKVTNMWGMFYNTPFNQPIGNWNVGRVTNMVVMFFTTPFNQSIGDWDVSSVTDMSSMFRESQFNQPIGNWNVSYVTNMRRMFQNSQFNQPINRWCVRNIPEEPSFFSSSFLSITNKPIWGTCPTN